jgi:hypothetical protein
MKDFPCVKTCQYDVSTTLATFLMFLNFLFFSCGWHYFIFITPFHIYYIENYYIRDLSACTNYVETKDRSIQFCDKYPLRQELKLIS